MVAIRDCDLSSPAGFCWHSYGLLSGLSAVLSGSAAWAVDGIFRCVWGIRWIVEVVVIRWKSKEATIQWRSAKDPVIGRQAETGRYTPWPGAVSGSAGICHCLRWNEEQNSQYDSYDGGPHL